MSADGGGRGRRARAGRDRELRDRDHGRPAARRQRHRVPQRPHRGERRADHRGRRGPGAAPRGDGARRVDGTGCLATPGLVNTHHHLYQWLTQGRAQQSVLFDWLTELYPVWARIEPGAGPRGGHGRTGLAGPVRVQHQHRSPLHLPAGREIRDAVRGRGRRPGRARGGDRRGRGRRAAVPSRAAARWTSAGPAGGLPPDEIVEDPDDRAGRDGRGDPPVPRPLPRRHGAGRGGTVLPVLGQPAGSCARWPSWPAGWASGCTPTWPRPARRTRTAGRRSAGPRPSTPTISAGSARTSGWRTACTWTSRRSSGSP